MKRPSAYGIFCMALLGVYGVAGWRGWEPGPKPAVRTIPKQIRQSSGGYRSFVYWRGGK